MYYVYILENKKGNSYIGSCKDIDARLKKHNQNSVRATKNNGPYEVIHREEFNSKTKARQRENQFKKYKNLGYIKTLLQIPSPSSSLV